MDGGQARVPRAAKALAATVLLVGLLTVVALAARGAHPGGHGRIAQRHVPAQVNDDLLTIITILYVAGAVALVVAFFLYRNEWHATESHWLRNLATTLAALLLVTAVGYRLFEQRGVYRRAQELAQKQRDRASRAPEPQLTRHLRRVKSGGAHFDSTLALGLLGLLVVGGAIFIVRRRASTRRPPLEQTPDVRTALAGVVSDAIDDLRNEPDPRRAVIAAYARMERVLARNGYARDPAETPSEYLARILARLDVRAGAVEELTALFERAKFSTHSVDELMKERAIAALVSVRADLDEPAVAA